MEESEERSSFLWQIISCSLIGLLIIVVCNFQTFSDRSFVCAFELITFYLKIRLDCKMYLPKHKKITRAINIFIQSAQQRQRDLEASE